MTLPYNKLTLRDSVIVDGQNQVYKSNNLSIYINSETGIIYLHEDMGE